MLVTDTKERILNAAERLFSEEGFAGTSLRAVTAAAGVNLAAVNYHFRSKEALFQEIVRRRLGTLAAERLLRLKALKASGREMTLEALLDAYVAPIFEFFQQNSEQGSILMRFLMRFISDPTPQIQQIVIAEAHEMAAEYSAAFAQVLPHLSPPELWWRFRMLNIVSIFQGVFALDTSLLMGRWLPNAPPQDMIDPAWLINFLQAALRAPATAAPNGA